MLFLLVVLLIFRTVLIMVRPDPISLHDPIMSAREYLHSIRATYILGLTLIIIYGITSGLEMLQSNHQLLLQWGLSRERVFNGKWWLLITNNFIHVNALHLYANIIGLILLASYEKRVGHMRYMAIFFISGIASSLLRFTFLDVELSVGASAGIYGLGAAYFMDKENIWDKKWQRALTIFLFIMAILFILETRDNTELTTVKIDHLAHIFGAFAAIMYIRFFPRRMTIEKNPLSALPTIHYRKTYTDRTAFLGKLSIGISSVTCVTIIIMSLSQVSSLHYLDTLLKQKMAALSRHDADCSYTIAELDVQKAARACGRLADAGYSDAFYVLGELIFMSNTPQATRSHQAARIIYERAANKGSDIALYRLGYYAEYGLTGVQDTNTAEMYYALAAKAGHPVAQLKMAQKEGGIFAPQAWQWYTQAWAQGVYNWQSLLIAGKNISGLK